MIVCAWSLFEFLQFMRMSATSDTQKKTNKGGGKTLTVRVDENLCIGAASCMVVAGDFFLLNDDGKAEVVENGKMKGYEYTLSNLTDAQIENILQGAKSCPTKAIFIHDEKGNQLYP